jgi:hypothetical protein
MTWPGTESLSECAEQHITLSSCSMFPVLVLRGFALLHHVGLIVTSILMRVWTRTRAAWRQGNDRQMDRSTHRTGMPSGRVLK